MCHDGGCEDRRLFVHLAGGDDRQLLGSLLHSATDVASRLSV